MKWRFVLFFQPEGDPKVVVHIHRELPGSEPAGRNPDGGVSVCLPMERGAGDRWEVTWSPGFGDGLFSCHYFYEWVDGDQTRLTEERGDRSLRWKKGDPEETVLVDHWSDPADPAYVFRKAPFTRALFLRGSGRQGKNNPGTAHEFRVCAFGLPPGENLCLLGNCQALGGWDPDHAVRMEREGPEWIARLPVWGTGGHLQYKYGIYREADGRFLGYETGDNRQVLLREAEGSRTRVSDNYFRTAAASWKAAGVSVPVFSLRSGQSAGVGEFQDLRMLADWASRSGLRLLQLLPVNDTSATGSWQDSYPYAAISAFALHPIYINLKKTGSLPRDHPLEIRYLETRDRFNALPAVDYEGVLKWKWQYLEALYARQSESFLSDKGFLDFFLEHQDWLVPYAVFCYLKEIHGTADYERFGAFSVYDPDRVRAFAAPEHPHFDRIAVHYFVQYHLHLQLSDATRYAHRNGVVLKGDIPIGIYRHSVDAWVSPGEFFLTMQSGAPPDGFAAKGQNWGFPTYRWEAMEANGFSWWKRRLRHLAVYFDVIRFDHILGFFRIWQIPMDAVEGILGHFHPAIPVSGEELSSLAADFTEERYCCPLINRKILEEFFGGDADTVATFFLEQTSRNDYRLKRSFDTQRKIEDFFHRHEKETNAFPGHWKLGLFDLCANILFLRAGEGSGCYHPRFRMMDTSSFQALDEGLREKLKRLHDDYFYLRQDRFWQKEAFRKLPALKQATDMLVCGEDLGMVPRTVPETMRALGLLSLEVQRMPKHTGLEFTSLGEVPYLSVVTPGTHDMSTLRGWWQENPEMTQRFYSQVLGHHGSAPYLCEPWVAKQIIERHLQAPAMWALIQLQDLFALYGPLLREDPYDERINIPANANHYWRYRMHVTLEALLNEKPFQEMIRNLIRFSGRDTPNPKEL